MVMAVRNESGVVQAGAKIHPGDPPRPYRWTEPTDDPRPTQAGRWTGLGSLSLPVWPNPNGLNGKPPVWPASQRCKSFGQAVL